MSLLNKFRDDKEELSKIYRDVLDNLNDDDKIKKIHDILKSSQQGFIIPLIGKKFYILSNIVRYYNLQNNEKLKDLIIKTFGKNPKYSYKCSLLIEKPIKELENVIEKDEFYSEQYKKWINNNEKTS